MKNNNYLLADECFRVSQVCSNTSHVILRAEHLPTRLTMERSVPFAEEPVQRSLLLAELTSVVQQRYPESDFIVERLYRGVGQGAGLIIRHLPSGYSVYRDINHGPEFHQIRELFVEIIQKIQS